MANKQSSKDLRKVREQLDRFLNDSVRDKVEVAVPASLKRSFLREHTPEGVSTERWVCFARYIVSRVLTATRNNQIKRSKTGKLTKWVWLPIEAFHEAGQNQYVLMRDKLLQLNILEWDNHYSHEEHLTYGYRLGKYVRNQPIVMRSIKDAAVKGAVINYRLQELEKQKPRIRRIAHVAQWWLRYEDVELDKAAAVEYLDLYRDVMRRRLKKRLSTQNRSKQAEDELRTGIEDKYWYAVHQVERWGKRLHLSVDGKGGRFYNPLVSLLSPLRNFVTVKGQQLVSFDIKNSQPLHLLLLLRDDFWSKDSRLSWSLRKLNPGLWEYVNKTRETERRVTSASSSSTSNSTSPSIEFKKRGQSPRFQSVENTHFAKLVLSGQLYEFKRRTFINRFFDSRGKDLFATRELAKQQVLTLMYFDLSNPLSPSQRPFKYFSELFPDVASIIRLLKSRDYREFPVLLQKLEAKIMLENVCRNIYDQHPTAWFATVHDSIITTEEYASQVETLILSTYEKVLGAEPQLERVVLAPRTAYEKLSRYVNSKLDQEVGAAEVTDDSKLTLDDIKRKLQSRLSQSPMIPFDPGVSGVSVTPTPEWGSTHSNPFIQRKLKK